MRRVLTRAETDRFQVYIDQAIDEADREARSREFARMWRDDMAGRRATWRRTLRRGARVLLFALAALLCLAFARAILATPVLPAGDAWGVPEAPASPQTDPETSGNLIRRLCTPPPAHNRATLTAIAQATGHALDVPAELLVAQAGVESSLRPHAAGSAGEVGPMQLSAAVARRWGVDRHDPCANIIGGALELRSHYRPEKGGWTYALTRYNGRGPMARAYAQRVLRAWESAAWEVAE